MILLIILSVLIMIAGLALSVYALVIQELPLLISSLSIITASISGLIAILVLKANRDKERPFLVVEPNYKRYGAIQISVVNRGTEIAIIQDYKTDNEIKLLRGENFFQQIIGATIPPGDSINFMLMRLSDYKEKSPDYTTEGIIYYNDIKGKHFSNNIYFNIEQLGPTSYNDDEERKMFYELQKIPKSLNEIKSELNRINKN